MLISILGWIAGSMGVAYLAFKNKCDPIPFFFGSLFLSPLIMFPALLGWIYIKEKDKELKDSKAPNELCTSLEEAYKLYLNKMISADEYESQKRNIILIFQTQEITEEPNKILLKLVPLAQKGILNEDELNDIKNKLGYGRRAS